MKVIDHEPQSWFLLEDQGTLFLDGNYTHSFLGYDWMIQLNPNELAQYRKHGREFICRLAADVQNSVPILKAGSSLYKNRRVSSELYNKASEAIKEWLALKPS